MKRTWYLIGNNKLYLSELLVSNKDTKATWTKIIPTEDINKSIKFTDRRSTKLLLDFLNDNSQEDWKIVSAEEDVPDDYYDTINSKH